MWKTMISSAMGENQYFHGIDWSNWVPKSLQEIMREEMEEERQRIRSSKPIKQRATNERWNEIKEAARQRNKAMGIQTRKNILNALEGLESATTNELSQLCGYGGEYMAKLLTRYCKAGYISKRRNGTFSAWVFVKHPEE